MFGETPAGILLLDFLLFLFGIVTVPLLYNIFTSLRSLLNGVGALTEQIGHLCETNKEIKKELVNTQLRDKDLENALSTIQTQIDNCQEDVNKQITELRNQIT